MQREVPNAKREHIENVVDVSVAMQRQVSISNKASFTLEVFFPKKYQKEKHMV